MEERELESRAEAKTREQLFTVFQWVFIITVIALTAVSVYTFVLHHGGPQSSGDVRALFPRASAGLDRLRRMEQLFGPGLFDSIVVPVPVEPDEALKETLRTMGDEIAQIDGIIGVVTPLEGYSRLGVPLRLLSADRKFARFLVEVDGTLSDTARAEVNDALSGVLANYAEHQPARSGPFSLSEEATRGLEAENRAWTPLCLVALGVLITVIFRSLRLAATLLVISALPPVWIGAALLLRRETLTPIAQLAPPLLLALCASYNVYVASRYRRAADRTADLQGLGASLLLAVGTTVAGFVSLLPIDVVSVTQFAWIMTAGSALGAALAYFVVPLVLPRVFAEQPEVTGPAAHWFPHHPQVLRIGVLVLLIGSLVLGLGVLRMDVDTSPLDFLPHDSPSFARLADLREQFPGTHVIALVVERAAQPLTAEDITLVDRFSREARLIQNVRWTTSAADFKRLAERVEKLELPSVFSELGPASITTDNGRATRVFVENDCEGRELLTLESALRELGQRVFGDEQHLSWYLASRELVMAEQSTKLSRGLLTSVWSALALVGALLFGIFRRPWFALLGLLPSIVAILAVLGTLGFVSREVNLGASMVAAVTLGMVSDVTFHLLIAWQIARRSGAVDPVQEALRVSLVPSAVTIAVLVGGFAPTIFSEILPVREFGILLSAALVLGLVANALLLTFFLRRS